MNKLITALLIAFSFGLNAQLYTPGLGVTDIDGNNYQSIIINGQEWMSENLRTAKYANGNPIPNETDGSQWVNLTTGAWALYNNDSQYEIPYGKFYNWYTVADPRNVCPTGWHVPSDSEWTTLTDYLGGQLVAGGKMKSTGTQYWASSNSDATNESGFSGLPGGIRDGNGAFNGISDGGYWWSSMEENTISAWSRALGRYNGNVSIGFVNKSYGFSVRCLKPSTSGISELKPTFKTLIKITDIMGRETVVKNNEVLFYLYSDGSVEKKVISE
jgi:uncharacterized protein (TIGR02145 family)